jgi:SAM-dependent methyltransferase
MSEYLLTQDGAEQLEQTRLALLEEFADSITRRLLDLIGVGEGWRCLDAGAGAGSVARMLARRVGPTGRVLATDLDTRLLEELTCSNVEVRRHDLLTDPLPQAAFDLVHARHLLMHLPARLTAIHHLISAARPGGWIAITDTDFTAVKISPASPAWSRAWSAFCDAQIAGGWDLRYGQRLCADLQSAGLADIQFEAVGSCQPGGTLTPRLLSLTLERLRDRMLNLGATDDDIDEARRLLEHHETTVHPPTTYIAHARRPADQP